MSTLKSKSREYRLFEGLTGSPVCLHHSPRELARDEIVRDRPKEGESIFPRVFAGFSAGPY